MSETRDALSDLVKHPGWALFTQHCQDEWGLQGTRYHEEMDKALDMSDPGVAQLRALQVRATRRLVEILLEWPSQEVSRLGRVEEPVALSQGRGGYR